MPTSARPETAHGRRPGIKKRLKPKAKSQLAISCVLLLAFGFWLLAQQQLLCQHRPNRRPQAPTIVPRDRPLPERALDNVASWGQLARLERNLLLARVAL